MSTGLASYPRDYQSPQDGKWFVAAVLLLYGALHLATINAYGWFRDEFYYIACGEHLDFGYVDHPPLVALIARVTRGLLGESLAAARLPSLLAGMAVIWLCGRIAREMGGGRWAQGMAALCALVAPVYLFLFHILSMNPFDVLFWTLGAWVVVKIVSGGDPKLWLLFGLICGLGLQNKHSLLFFGFGVFAGLLLTPERRHFRERWIWMGGAIAALLVLPHVIWQMAHGWPTAEFVRNATAYKNVALSPLAFFGEQIMQMHPLTFPVWLAGLVWLFRSRYRVLGWAYVAAFLVLITQASKAYYLAPAYPPLFAAGAIAIERWIRRPALRAAPAGPPPRGRSGHGSAHPAHPAGRDLHPLRASPRDRDERGRAPRDGRAAAALRGHARLGRDGRRGGPRLPLAAARGAGGCGDLRPELRRGRCHRSAGKKYGLPKASSGHNNYFLWGPQGSGEILIIIGGDAEDHRQAFTDVRQAGEVHCGGLCMPYEDNLPVWIARGLKAPIDQIWPMTKHYD